MMGTCLSAGGVRGTLGRRLPRFSSRVNRGAAHLQSFLVAAPWGIEGTCRRRIIAVASPREWEKQKGVVRATPNVTSRDGLYYGNGTSELLRVNACSFPRATMAREQKEGSVSAPAAGSMGSCRAESVCGLLPRVPRSERETTARDSILSRPGVLGFFPRTDPELRGDDKYSLHPPTPVLDGPYTITSS